MPCSGPSTLWLLTALLLAVPATASSDEPDRPARHFPIRAPKFVSHGSPDEWALRLPTRPRPFFKTDKLRYGQSGILKRTASDLVGIPLNIAWWDGRDFALAALVSTAGAGFMAPGSPSADAAIQETIHANEHPTLTALFPVVRTEAMALGAGAWIGAAALVGWLGNEPELQEYASLMAEALLVTHAFHISGKLLTGREPPDKNSGQGTVHGPERGSDIFPSGTPSGHAATVCTMAAVTLEHYHSRPIDVASVLACAYMSGSVLYNDQHFASDVIWGAAMGWFIGQWVARHRSKRGGRSHPQSLAQSHDVFILPFGTDIESGIGVSLLIPFH